MDGYRKVPVAWLPEMTVEGMPEPVFKVVDAATGELVYALRTRTPRFQPWTFSEAAVDVWVGEPGTSQWICLGGLEPSRTPPTEGMQVRFDS